FYTPKKTVKHKREGGNEKEDGKMKKAELITKKIPLKALIPKIPKKSLANKVPRKRRVEFPELENIQSTAKNLLQQVVPGEILEVVNNLMVDDDVEVGREVNFNAISSEYGGDLLEGDKKNNDDKKDVEEKVKFEEEQPQVAEEDDSEPPTIVEYYNGKKDEVFSEEEDS
ncbi:hypothetical protein GIB67_022581, partial [Kingdonia uniflora]